MGTQTSTTHVFRQRSSLILAAVCGVVGVLLLGSLAWNWSAYPRPLFAAWVLLLLAASWSVFLRPSVRLDAGGVTLQNVLRDIRIPWSQLTETSSRWNLKVFAGDHGYTAWAISREPDRPKRGGAGVFRMPTPGHVQGVSSAGTRPSMTMPKVTAQSVGETIREAKREYDDAVSPGQPPASTDETVKVTWVPLVLALLVVPAIAVVVLSLT
jgi:hypothetical protein